MLSRSRLRENSKQRIGAKKCILISAGFCLRYLCKQENAGQHGQFCSCIIHSSFFIKFMENIKRWLLEMLALKKNRKMQTSVWLGQLGQFCSCIFLTLIVLFIFSSLSPPFWVRCKYQNGGPKNVIAKYGNFFLSIMVHFFKTSCCISV